MRDSELNELLDQLSGDWDDDDDVGADVSIGAQEIVGYNELIGAAVKQALSKRMARARHIDPNAVALVQGKTGPRRRKLMGGTTTSIGAGATAIIEFEAQENFRPEDFFVQSVNIASFLITSIKVGTEEQLVNSGSVPADVFSVLCLRSSIHFKTMNLGTKLAVSVTNTSGGALTFNSAFIGTAVE